MTKRDDLAKQLRAVAEATGPNEARRIALDAADRIEDLEAKLAKVRAEAHAEAIEAAEGAATREISAEVDENERPLSRTEMEMTLDVARAIRALHTDASIKYLKDREERLNLAVLKEVLKDAAAKAEKNSISDGSGNYTFNNIEDAKAAVQADYERRIFSAITTRSASEAYAAAIEAAKAKITNIANAYIQTAWEKLTIPDLGKMLAENAADLDTLHTDASSSWLKEHDKKVREEALMEAADRLRIMGDMGGRAIITALLEKEGE